MFEQHSLLGARDGVLLVASAQSDFAERFALRVGRDLIPFAVYEAPAVSLLRGQDILSHTRRGVSNPWVLGPDSGGCQGSDGASLTHYLNREWEVNGRQPWLLSAEPDQAPVSATLEDPAYGVDIPVLPGVGYELCVLVAIHQARGEVRLRFCDGSGSPIHEVTAALSNAYRGGTERESYQNAKVRTSAPAEAATARIEVQLSRHQAEPDAAVQRSFMLLLECSLRVCPNASPDWIPSPDSVPLLVRTAVGAQQPSIYGAPAELGLGTGVRRAEIVALDEPDEPVARWSAGLRGARASIIRFVGNGLRVQISGTAKPLALYVDGQRACAIPAPPPAKGASPRKTHIVIAEPWCDGDAHVVEVRDFSGSHLLDRTQLILPTALTSWRTIQQRSSAPLPFHMAPAASYRYVSLRQRMTRLEERVASGEADEGDLRAMAQISRLHRVLEAGFEKNTDFAPVHFPQVERPTVSVVIPVHNKFSVTYHCLASLRLAPNDTSFEVVVVDDGSDDQTRAISDVAPGITIVRHESAVGFVGACNHGAAVAKGEYLVLLNNDTELTAGWLDELLAGFDRFPDVGMTGARLLWPNGRVQDAGGIVWDSGNPWNYGRNQSPADPRFCYARQADYLSGAALMIRRSVWDEVGGLSEEFAPAYFEDTDLSFKVRAAGYSTWFIPSANVFHHEGISNGTDVTVSTGMKRFQEVNRPTFKEKWATAYVDNGREGEDPDLAKDRGIVGRVLFIDRGIPRPDHDAGSFAAIQEMRLVQSLGYKVTFLPLDVAYMGQYTEDLGRLGIETIYSPFAVSVLDFLERRGREFDVVYITRYNVAERVLSEVRQHAPDAKVLFCNADLHFLRELRAARVSGDEKLFDKALQTRTAELGVMHQVDVVLSYNQVEHAVILSHGIGDTEVVTCPWVVDTVPDAEVSPFSHRRGLAFLGGYLHPPNVEAVEFFISDVLPKLRDRIPGLRFNIYGADMPDRFHDLADEVINPVGYVRSVDEVYDHNRLFVAPLISGAGIKGKVLGALAHGLPSILSPLAAEGTGVRRGLDCLVAESVEEWVQAILTLYDDETAWDRMSRNARDFTAQNYSFAKGRELMRRAFHAAGIHPFSDREIN